MNRLEEEVLAEIESEDYEFNEDKAKAIVEIVREAVLQEIKDKEIVILETQQEYLKKLIDSSTAGNKPYSPNQHYNKIKGVSDKYSVPDAHKHIPTRAMVSFQPNGRGGKDAVCSTCGVVGTITAKESESTGDEIMNLQRWIVDKHRNEKH